jgi:hypothetical protein
MNTSNRSDTANRSGAVCRRIPATLFRLAVLSFLIVLSFLLTDPFCFAGAEVPAAVNRPVKDKWALVVGVSKFEDARMNLKYSSKDAEAFYKYLVNEGRFAADHVMLLTDEKATRANILSLIGDRWLPRVANPDDLVVIFISSHGSPADFDVGGLNYIVAHDTNVDCLYATGIPLQDLMRTIKARVHSDRVVIILDACHSGAASADAKGLFRAGNIDASAVAAGTGQLVIASSKPDQASWEGKNYANGVFTHHLIESLRLHENKSRLKDAFENLKENVQVEVLRDRGQLQTPEMKCKWQGDDLVLSVVPSRPRSGIPIEMLESLPAADSGKPVTLKPAVLPPKTVLDAGNLYRVFNQPQTPTKFKLETPALVTYLYTYHWNEGRGATPGTIALKCDDGTIYGPFQTSGKPEQGKVVNVYWECEPMVEVKAGTYTVIDSEPATWAQNAGTNYSGFARVKIVPRALEAAKEQTASIKRSPVGKIFDNGNIYLVYNKPSKPTCFTINAPLLVTYIRNYHWNNGKGQDPGNITLVHQDGTVYGPFRSHGLAGQGNVPNASWVCEVEALLKPGLYMVLDSDSDTWSCNPENGGTGMTEIKGVLQN